MRRRLAGGLATALAMAYVTACASCGAGNGASKTSPPSGGGPRTDWKDDAATVTPDFALAPPLLFPGEQIVYRITLHGVELADYAIAVGTEVTEIDGVPVIVAETRIYNMGLMAKLKKIDNVFTSYIDARTNRPIEFRSEEKEDDDYHEVAITRFAPGEFPVSVELNEKPAVVETQKANPGEQVLDLNTMYFALRGWDAAEGSTATINAMRSSNLWRMQLTVGGFESISTALGEFPTIRYDAQSRKLTRDFAVNEEAGQRHFSIWITDDESRLPVYLVAKTDYGDVKMQIVVYEPGTGERLRVKP